MFLRLRSEIWTRADGFAGTTTTRLPASLGGGEITLRLHANEHDKARGLNRTENVRPIPQGDPEFARLYARRNDVDQPGAERHPFVELDGVDVLKCSTSAGGENRQCLVSRDDRGSFAGGTVSESRITPFGVRTRTSPPPFFERSSFAARSAAP
jgi:hypothetical protein